MCITATITMMGATMNKTDKDGFFFIIVVTAVVMVVASQMYMFPKKSYLYPYLISVAQKNKT